MLESDFAFPHNYEIEEFGGPPGTGTLNVPLIYFPLPKGRPEHNGEWLNLIECKNWTNRVGSAEVNWFDAKLRNRGLTFGILVTTLA